MDIRREIMKRQLRKQNIKIVRVHSWLQGESVVQYLHIRDAEAS